MAKHKGLPPEAMAYYLTHPVQFVEQQVYGIKRPGGLYRTLTPQEVAEDRFNARLEWQSKEILNAVAQHDYVSIHSGRGIGKCVGEDEDILLADGRYEKARDLIGKYFGVLSFEPNKNFDIRHGKTIKPCLAYAFDNGEKDCYRIRTVYGRELIRTHNHPLLKFDGWTEAENLEVGDKVATLKELPVEGVDEIDDDIVILLATLIGDGTLSGGSVRISQQENKLLGEFERIVKKFNCYLKRINEYDYAIQCNTLPHPINAICREYDIMGKTSYTKTVPKRIYELTNRQVAIFLNYLFATDRTAYPGDDLHRGLSIGITSVSRELLVGVQRLMLRFGILGKVGKRKTTWTHNGVKNVSHAYNWSIQDYESVLKFCDNITICGKEDKLERCRQSALKRVENGKEGLTGIKVWPSEARKFILGYPEAKGFPQQELRNNIGIRHRKKEFCVTEKLVRRFNDKYPTPWIDSLLDAGIRWDEIKEIEYIGKKRTVGIEVKSEHHNYVCDLVEHNTTSFAWLALWFLYTREHARVIVTGPKFDQLKITIWAEIQKWLLRSYLGDELRWTSERLYHLSSPGTWFGRIITAAEKENISGIHAEHVLWLIDEASNVEDEMIENILGGMTDLECKIALAGNPTKITGIFHKSFTLDKENWHVLHYNSEDSARKNKLWYKRMLKYPRESDMFRVNVLGLSPQGNPKAVISLTDVVAARDRDIRKPAPYLEMGVDPAAEGNDLFTIALRHGLKLIEVKTFAKTKSPVEGEFLVLKMLREYRAKTKLKCKCRIKIDNGGYGASIRQLLALNEKDNIEVIPINFGRIKHEEYVDHITKMWFELDQMINEISLPNDEELIEELCSREWSAVDQSKVKVELKAKFKERLGRSPDRSDAVVMCFTEGTKKVFTRNLDTEPNVRKFEIDYDLAKLFDPSFEGLLFAEIIHLCAIVLNTDLTINGLAACYQYHTNRLWIYGEFYHQYPMVEHITSKATLLTKKNRFHDDREARFLGNSKMFRPKEEQMPFSKVLRRGGLYVAEPVHYDEYGAISLGLQLYDDEKMIIHHNVIRFREQFNLWALKDSRPQDGFGYCEALLLILSEVRRRKKPPTPEIRMPDYRTKKKDEPEYDKLGWMKR